MPAPDDLTEDRPAPARERAGRRRGQEQAAVNLHRRRAVPRLLIAAGSALLLLAVLLVVVLALLLKREHTVKSEASGLQGDLRQAEQALTAHSDIPAAQRVTAADQAVGTLQLHSDRLLKETHGTLWSIGSHLPGLSKPLDATHQLAEIADQVSRQILPPYVETLGTVASQRLSTGLDLAPLQARSKAFDANLTALVGIQATGEAIPHTGIGALDNARLQLLKGVAELRGYANTLAVAAHVAPDLVGTNGPRHDLVILQTPAEARGTGGLVGGYVVLAADKGKLTVTKQGSNHDLVGAKKPVVALDPQFENLYGNRYATVDWTDSNLSPDFAQVGAIWAGLYKAQTGIAADGVIGLTPEVLGRVLAQTGPVTVGSVQLTGANAAYVFEKGIYARYPAVDQEAQRTTFQTTALRAVLDKVLAFDGDPLKLLSALGQGAATRQIELYSSTPAEEGQLISTPVAGALPSTPGPFFGLAINNDDASKLDAYLKITTTYRRTAIPGDSAHQRVMATITLQNTAPSHGLSPYVTFQAGSSANGGLPAGTHSLLLSVYLADQAKLSSATRDGKPLKPSLTGQERSHLFIELLVQGLRPGASSTVTVTATEPTDATTPGLFGLVPSTLDTSAR